MSHLTSRRSDGGLTIQGSCLKDKPNLRTVERGTHLWSLVDTSVYTYLCTVNVKHTLSCTQYSKIATKGVGIQYLGVAGRLSWSKTWEGPLTFYIFYSTQQDTTTPAWAGNCTCERLITAYGDSLGPRVTFVHVTGPDKKNQDTASPQRVLKSTICWMQSDHGLSLVQVLH